MLKKDWQIIQDAYNSRAKVSYSSMVETGAGNVGTHTSQVTDVTYDHVAIMLLCDVTFGYHRPELYSTYEPNWITVMALLCCFMYTRYWLVVGLIGWYHRIPINSLIGISSHVVESESSSLGWTLVTFKFTSGGKCLLGDSYDTECNLIFIA